MNLLPKYDKVVYMETYDCANVIFVIVVNTFVAFMHFILIQYHNVVKNFMLLLRSLF